MVVDFDGRILAQAEPGPGERIVVAPVDIAALRAERQRRRGHHMLSHLRTELYCAYRKPVYKPAALADNWPISVDGSNRAIEAAKEKTKR
jgi:hypothetical protein